MMNFRKSAISLAVASVVSVGTVAPVVAGELSASAGVASSYLWRGFDLGKGDPAMSASLDYSEGMFYAGAWVSSGDASAGTEYDLYMGLAGEAGGISWDIGIISYVYPSAGDSMDFTPGTLEVTNTIVSNPAAVDPEIDTHSVESVAYTASSLTMGDFYKTGGTVGDAMEAYIGLGMGPVSVMHYSNIAGNDGYIADSDYTYTTVSLEAGSFGAMYGKHKDGLDHFDLSYGFNDSLAFTYSIPLDDDASDLEPVLVASYSFSL
ncbi:MAG: hypothetical protein CMK29_04935 [Porticoccaceae bacterium]|nr:hypothetical protein [Porticoccaceae bacterium]